MSSVHCLRFNPEVEGDLKKSSDFFNGRFF